MEAAQQSDGGWNISWEPISPGVVCEWRGAVTIGKLLCYKPGTGCRCPRHESAFKPVMFPRFAVSCGRSLLAASLLAQLPAPLNPPKPLNPLERASESTPRLSELVSGVIPGASVQKDLDTGQIRRVRGRVPVAGARTPRQAAERFLTTNSGTLGLSANLGERLCRFSARCPIKGSVAQ
jgi:hypothetical protein